MTNEPSAINAAVALTEPNSSPARKNRHRAHVSLVLAVALAVSQAGAAAPTCQDVFAPKSSALRTLTQPVVNVIDALRTLVLPRAPTGPDVVRKAKTGDTVITTFSFANVISFQIAIQQPGAPLRAFIEKSLQGEVDRLTKEVQEALVERENLLVTVDNAVSNPMLRSRGDRAESQIKGLDIHLAVVRSTGNELKRIQAKLFLDQPLSTSELSTLQNHKFQLSEKIESLAGRNRALVRLQETMKSPDLKLEGVAKIGPKGWARLKMLVVRYKKPLMIGGALAVAAGLGGYNWFDVSKSVLNNTSTDQGEESDVSEVIPPEDLVVFTP